MSLLNTDYYFEVLSGWPAIAGNSKALQSVIKIEPSAEIDTGDLVTLSGTANKPVVTLAGAGGVPEEQRPLLAFSGNDDHDGKFLMKSTALVSKVVVATSRFALPTGTDPIVATDTPVQKATKLKAIADYYATMTPLVAVDAQPDVYDDAGYIFGYVAEYRPVSTPKTRNGILVYWIPNRV